MVAKILDLQGDKTSIGIDWIRRFLTRHPQMKGMNAKPMDQARIEAPTPQKIDDLYTLFDCVKRDFQVRPGNIWNMDEHGRTWTCSWNVHKSAGNLCIK